MLKVLIVCGYDAEYTVAVKTHQHRLGNGTAYVGLRTASKLINQNE